MKNSPVDTEMSKAAESQKTGKEIKLKIGMIGFGTVGRSVREDHLPGSERAFRADLHLQP